MHIHLGLIFIPEDCKEVSPGIPYDITLITAPLCTPTNTTIDKTQRLQDEFKESHQLYKDTVDVKKALTKQIVDAIEKKYLQEIYNTITKIITKHVLEFIQYLFENYGQVRQTTLNEHE